MPATKSPKKSKRSQSPIQSQPEIPPEESDLEKLESGIPSLESEPVEIEVEDHQESPASKSGLGELLNRAQKNLTREFTPEEDKPTKSKKRDRASSHYVRPQQREDITTLVSSLLALLMAAWSVPPGLKPDEDEVGALASYSTRLLLRHVNLSGRITADVLDVIGIVAVVSGWYARTAPAWRVYMESQQKALEPARRSEAEPSQPGQASGPADPIAEAAPEVDEFLQRSRKAAAEGGSGNE